MIFTARQIQDLAGSGQSKEQIILPYGTRLTPLALDWIRSKRLKIGYGPTETIDKHGQPVSVPANSPAGAKTLLWWCDGPCGAAKAAISAQSRESSMASMDIQNEAGQLISAIKYIAKRIKSQEAGGGVLLVKSAAEANVYANRCRSLRAIVGTCLESLEQGIAAVAVNVLIVEYPYKSVSQIRNLLSRFARAEKNPSEQAQRRLEELASCA